MAGPHVLLLVSRGNDKVRRTAGRGLAGQAGNVKQAKVRLPQGTILCGVPRPSLMWPRPMGSLGAVPDDGLPNLGKLELECLPTESKLSPLPPLLPPFPLQSWMLSPQKSCNSRREGGDVIVGTRSVCCADGASGILGPGTVMWWLAS